MELDEIVKPIGAPIPISEIVRIKASTLDDKPVEVVALVGQDLDLLNNASRSIAPFINAAEER